MSFFSHQFPLHCLIPTVNITKERALFSTPVSTALTNPSGQYCKKNRSFHCIDKSQRSTLQKVELFFKQVPTALTNSGGQPYKKWASFSHQFPPHWPILAVPIAKSQVPIALSNPSGQHYKKVSIFFFPHQFPPHWPTLAVNIVKTQVSAALTNPSGQHCKKLSSFFQASSHWIDQFQRST